MTNSPSLPSSFSFSFWFSLGLSFWLSSCAQQVAPPARTPIAATQKNATSGRRVRLGWVSWQDATSIIYCNRRVDDNGGAVGVLGPCRQLAVDGTSHALVSWLNSEQPDPSNSDATPFACALEQEDARLAPDARPARVWLVGKTGRELVDEWTPDAARLTADAYSIEPSFSPDGKLVAYLHLAVGLGEGERTIEIPSVELRAAPACK